MGPGDARLVRRDESGLDRRAARRISGGASFPGHRSPPRVSGDADQTPLGLGWDHMYIVLVKDRVKEYFDIFRKGMSLA